MVIDFLICHLACLPATGWSHGRFIGKREAMIYFRLPLKGDDDEKERNAGAAARNTHRSISPFRIFDAHPLGKYFHIRLAFVFGKSREDARNLLSSDGVRRHGAAR